MLRAAALLMIGLGTLYSLGLAHESRQDFAGVATSVRTSLQFVTTSIGPAGRTTWPASGLVIAVLCAATAVLLLVAWRTRPRERVRAAGFLAILGGLGCVALAIGVSRAGMGWTVGFSPRYVMLACPILCVIYLAWLVYGGKRWSRFGPGLLCVGLLVLLPVNNRLGLRWAKEQSKYDQAFLADVRAGVSPSELAERHWNVLSGEITDMADHIESMRRTGLGIYKR